MPDPLGSNKNATTRESARDMVEKYRRSILARVKADGAGFYDAGDFRDWCGVGEKDRMRGDFVVQAAKRLVQEGELQSVKGGMFKRVEQEEDASSDDGTNEAALDRLDQDATASVDELVEIDVPEGSSPKEVDDEAPAPEVSAQVAAPVITPIKRRMSPRGGFRAWALEYMQPDVIFQTRDLLRLAVEAEVVVTTAAGQLQLNRLVKEGVLSRKRRGYVSLASTEAVSSAPAVPVEEPHDAMSAPLPSPEPDRPPHEPVSDSKPSRGTFRAWALNSLGHVDGHAIDLKILSEAAVEAGEARTEAEARKKWLALVQRGDVERVKGDKLRVKIVEIAKPKPARKKASKKPKAVRKPQKKVSKPKAEPDILAEFTELFRVQRDELKARLKETDSARKDLSATIQTAHSALDKLDAVRADARTRIDGLDHALKSLEGLSRSLRPRSR